MNPLEWIDATTIDEALAAIAGGAVIKAGGVDLTDRMKEGISAPARLVNLRTVRGIDGIVEDAALGVLRIGTLVTLARLGDDPLVRGRFRALAEAAGHAATPQIRAMSTIGGNLLQRPRCWYFRAEAFPCRRKGGTRCYAIEPAEPQARSIQFLGELEGPRPSNGIEGENRYHAIFDNGTCAIVHPSATATPLVALGARVVIASSVAKSGAGAREVALESIFVRPEQDVTREHALAPAEMITEVRVPLLPKGASSAYTKLGEKESFDWPIADVACVIEREGDRCKRASIVLGAAAPVPWRASEAEAALAGKPLGEEFARIAAKASVRGATPLTQNAYKVPVFEAIVRRTILAAMHGTQEAR